MLATGSTDFATKLWDVDSGKQLASWGRHVGEVGSVAFTHDGEWLISGGFDGRVHVRYVGSNADLVCSWLVGYLDTQDLADALGETPSVCS